jgi:hypothetical protein
MKGRRKTKTSGGPETGGTASLEPRPGSPDRSDRSIYWILGGLVITGILAGYQWLRSLPRD